MMGHAILQWQPVPSNEQVHFKAVNAVNTFIKQYDLIRNKINANKVYAGSANKNGFAKNKT